MKRRRFSRQRWAQWIDGQKNSGRSVRQFCRAKGISENSFYAWRRKISETELSMAASAGPAAAVAASFVPVSLIDGRGSQVQIDLPCGATIRLPDCDKATQRVLTVLLQEGVQR